MLEMIKVDIPDAEPDVGLRVVSLEQKVDFLYKVLAFVIEGVDERGSATSWFFDARYPSDCSNLYEAEYSDKNVKRWVGPAPQLVFRPSLKADTDYVLTTSIMDFITPEAEKDFGIVVNGVQLKVARKGRTNFSVRFRTSQGGPQVVTLFSSASKSPQELNISSDKRSISFSISSISIVKLHD
jgi:hypothetical protein